ncbi:MAG: PIG-L family deacetylase [Armatimonadetes bacterium]|nr:PIG-L family deacetylase [Armatimonadota bacterium]
MSDCPGRVMVIGAHPDDADFRAGGCAKLWKDLGFEVVFISATNGDAGHHEIGGGMLAQRRAAEAQASGDVIGIEYRLLEIHDAELVPSLEYRKLFITLIREFGPDLLFTHRPWDYHPDHRYTGQLVMDASFLVTVPNVCPLARHMDQSPVILYMEDGFQKPLPFQPDVVVDTDSALAEKGLMLHSHGSQVYEWLSRGVEVPTDTARR